MTNELVGEEGGKECMVEKRTGGKAGGLPCSGSWFCGGVMPKGAGDEEGEVE